MKTITIWKKECLNHFTSLRAYVMGALVLLFTSFIFWGEIKGHAIDASLRWMIGLQSFVFLAITPVLTMRVLSEENRSGTLELLLTSPVTEWDIVFGKFLGVLTLYLAFFTICLVYPASLMVISTPAKLPMLIQFLGLILCCGAYASVGIFASAVTQSQVTAALLSYMLLLGFWILGPISSWFGEKAQLILGALAPSQHLSGFSTGVADALDLYFFLGFIGLFLFLAQRSIEARRWAS